MKRSRTRKSGYLKVGDYVEVRVPRTANYMEVANSAALAVGLIVPNGSSSEEELLEESRGELSLFRAEGTRVPNSAFDQSTPWTIHEYMSSFPSYKRNGIAIKLGVGYTDPVSILVC